MMAIFRAAIHFLSTFLPRYDTENLALRVADRDRLVCRPMASSPMKRRTTTSAEGSTGEALCDVLLTTWTTALQWLGRTWSA